MANYTFISGTRWNTFFVYTKKTNQALKGRKRRKKKAVERERLAKKTIKNGYQDRIK